MLLNSLTVDANELIRAVDLSVEVDDGSALLIKINSSQIMGVIYGENYDKIAWGRSSLLSLLILFF